MKIHPAYDTTTRTWFVDEPISVEEPTIAELIAALKSLLPGAVIEVEGYHPQGYTLPPELRPNFSEERRETDRRAYELARRHAEPVRRYIPRLQGMRGPSRMFDRHAILALVREGVERSEIARRMGCSLATIVLAIKESREAGAPIMTWTEEQIRGREHV